jgi:hypothetical protein
MGLVNAYRIYELYKLIRKGIDKPELFNHQKYWYELFKAAHKVEEVRLMLSGYKSYIIAALAAGVQFMYSMGYIDEATYQMLIGLLGAGAIGTVSAKINRIQKDIDNKKF